MCETNNWRALRLRRESASAQRIKSYFACLNARFRALHLPPLSFRNTETVPDFLENL